jgi:protein-L-isoaspartate(D-aspartate) O-methyltransferase
VTGAPGGDFHDARMEALIGAMESKGYLPAPAETWKEVLRRVPRRTFVPDRGWVTQGVSDFTPSAIDRMARPDQWEAAVYVDAAIVTQADDGATDPASGAGQASSSLSALSGVLYNIGFLDLDDDHAVLEIGTGTGYTAALAARRVNAEANDGGTVVTLEVDPELAKQAERNLETSGDLPGRITVVVGDGAAGYPDGAPYDRVHATCSVQHIPRAWLAQTRPGGRIVTPYGGWFGYGLIAQIDVLPDGSGMGRFPGTSGYMHLRSQRPIGDHQAEWTTKPAPGVEVTRSRINPRSLAYAPAAADLVISVLVPGVTARRPDDALWLFDGNDVDCWAIATFAQYEGSFEVRQHGARRLWDEVAASYFQWQAWGRPELGRFGMTVGANGEQVWRDDPANVIGLVLSGAGREAGDRVIDAYDANRVVPVIGHGLGFEGVDELT